jgi:hypothetical protein
VGAVMITHAILANDLRFCSEEDQGLINKGKYYGFARNVSVRQWFFDSSLALEVGANSNSTDIKQPVNKYIHPELTP